MLGAVVPHEVAAQEENDSQEHLVDWCFTLLEVLLSMIVRSVVQVLPQSSAGIDSRDAGKDSVENSLSGCGAGVSSLTELIVSVINDGNVRFTPDINAGNIGFPTGINVDMNRRGKMCVHHRDEVQKCLYF